VYRPLLLHPNPAIQNGTNPANQIKTWQHSNATFQPAQSAYAVGFWLLVKMDTSDGRKSST